MVGVEIEATRSYVEKRIGNYSLPLLNRIVYSSTTETLTRVRADGSFRSALLAANYFDFYSETGNIAFKIEAWKQLGVLFHNMRDEDRTDLEEIGNEIVTFFKYEKQIWKKVLTGDEAVTDKEVREFLFRKSSDALFYARILQVYVPGKDFSLPLHANMQLLDIRSDIEEWDLDTNDGNPNILFMLLSQSVDVGVIKTLSKKEMVEKARKQEIDTKLIKIADEIKNSVNNFNFSGFGFLEETIESHYMAIIAELGLGEN